MHFLSVFSLRNRALIALVTVVVAIFGGVALTSLKQELIPSLSLPNIFIVTNYPGASPAVVDADVSTPIEAAIRSVPGLQSTTATSSNSVSTITAAFDYGTNIATAEQKTQLAINRIASTLPASANTQVLTFSFSDLPVIQIAVTSDLDPHDLSAKLNQSTIVDIKKLADVSDVSLLGTTNQRIVITPDPAKLLPLGLSNQSIKKALDDNGVLLPAGQITENQKTLIVQSGVRLMSADDIASLPLLGGNSASLVKSSDVATVATTDDPITGISRVQGKPSLTIAITKTPAGNTVEVSREVRKAIPDLEATLGNNTKFTVVFDQAPFIQESINSLATEGLLGLAFAVVIILLFLLSFRSTLVAAISIPISVLITFIGMQAAGYTLNIITLGALTIAIGRVVDDSIVVTENIKRHIALGEEKLQAIQSAVKEVAGAVTASTVTTIAVFLPLALVGDITGELFRPFALTVTIALAASLFVALTIVPVLAYWFMSSKAKVSKHADGMAAGELDHPSALQRGYLPIINWTLKRPVATILIAILLLGGTVALLPFMKTNFIGSSGQNNLTVSQTLPLGSSLDARDTAAKKVEDVLVGYPGVTTVQLSIGSSGSSLRQALSGGGASTFSLTTDAKLDQTKLQDGIRKELATIKDSGDITLAASGGGGFASSDIAINISAADEADLRTATDTVTTAMTGLSVAKQVTNNLSNEQPFIGVVVDKDKAAKAGLSEIQVGGIVGAALNPSAQGSVVVNEKTLSIYILNTSAPTTIEQLQNFSIPTNRGVVPLSDLATVSQTNGPSSITSIKGVRSSTVTITPKSDDVGTASAVVSQQLAKVTLPAGASANIGGVTSQQGTAFGQLGLALLVAILIVYVVMVATFKSLRQPLLLLVSVPFAATGAIALQIISGVPLGVASLIGVLLLVGIVVTNAIVLVDLINQYRVKGMRARDAIINGAARRLRPILMTALATIFALIPLGVGLTGNGGGFISQPLAIVVIGGLVSSTLLTLVVLPTLYYLVEGAKERREENGIVIVRTWLDILLVAIEVVAGLALLGGGGLLLARHDGTFFRGGWLEQNWLIAGIIAAVIGLGLLVLAVLQWRRGYRKPAPVADPAELETSGV